MIIGIQAGRWSFNEQALAERVACGRSTGCSLTAVGNRCSSVDTKAIIHFHANWDWNRPLGTKIVSVIGFL